MPRRITRCSPCKDRRCGRFWGGIWRARRQLACACRARVGPGRALSSAARAKRARTAWSSSPRPMQTRSPGTAGLGGNGYRGGPPRQGRLRRGAREAALPEGAVSVADESYPDGLLYHQEHDWAKVDGDTATFGVTWYAQDQLGEVVFFDPPDVGAQISANSAYAEVESVKAVSDVFAPMSGEVIEVNEALTD